MGAQFILLLGDLGDGLLATFGTPRPGPHDAGNAVAFLTDGSALVAANTPMNSIGATGALKYALLTAFLIPTGDDPENDGADATVAKAAEKIFGGSVKTAAKPAAKSVAPEEADF